MGFGEPEAERSFQTLEFYSFPKSESRLQNCCYFDIVRPMNDDTSKPPIGVPYDEVTTVSRKILAAYFVEVANTEGLADIAAELRKALLNDGAFNEAAIKAALFRGCA
jgi:hypothetical protein